MTTEEDDALQFLKLVPKKCELVIVDHYAIGSRWHNVIRTNFPVLAIDDLGDRSMAPDILINYNLNDGTHERYKSLISEHTHLWLGTKFLLLRSEYVKEVSTGARIRKNFGNIFVFMGGADSQNYTDQFLDLLIELFGNSKSIKVIVGASNPHKETLLDKYSKYSFVDILAPRQSIIDLLNWADLAIGAFGSTAYERAAVALPSVGLILADNQRTIGQTFADLGLAWTIDSKSRALKQQSANLLKSINIEEIYKQSSNLKHNFRVDGGAKRVAQHVQAFINKTDPQGS